MAKPQDRLGVFAVPASHDKLLRAETEAAYEAMLSGEPETRWYELRQDVFEHLVRVANRHRVLKSKAATDAFNTFILSKGVTKVWDKSSPKQRMQLARKHLATIKHAGLRKAVSDVVAKPGDLGLWIETEAALPPNLDKPQDRLGVFAVDVAEGPPESEVGHERFEHLLRVSTRHRVLTSKATREAFAALAKAVKWNRSSPLKRVELARKHLAKVKDMGLRAAIKEVLAAPGTFGLWIETEAVPPEPDDGEVVDVAKMIRRLDAYIAEQDWKDLKRKKLL
jgi:hypothetical protein